MARFTALFAARFLSLFTALFMALFKVLFVGLFTALFMAKRSPLLHFISTLGTGKLVSDKFTNN